MTLTTFLDLVWVEIWDDCPPMGDQHTYREIMERLFLNGEDPATITYKGADGKTHRLSERKKGQPPSKTQLDELRALQRRLRPKPAPAPTAH